MAIMQAQVDRLNRLSSPASEQQRSNTAVGFFFLLPSGQ